MYKKKSVCKCLNYMVWKIKRVLYILCPILIITEQCIHVHCTCTYMYMCACISVTIMDGAISCTTIKQKKHF